MSKENYNVVGVMSGTSLDGIDLAYLNFNNTGNGWQFTIGSCETVRYSDDWVTRLKSAINFNPEDLELLNIDYTKHLAETISAFIKRHSISDLDAVCSHGHTILHQPNNHYTLQIGNRPEIASLLKQTAVCDFRVGDVALGGQGAPLVPIGDRLLFHQYDYCLNLGGFSNVSFESSGKRIAFDISPVNTVLNYFANRLDLDFDDRGSIAASGNLNEELLHQLNTLDFYKLAYPKSLGFEYVRDVVLPLIQHSTAPVEDILRTFTEHIALQISIALPNKTGSILITGGGAYNTFLIDRIGYYLPEIKIAIPDKKILEFKEALIFGLLGVLRLRGETNVLSSVTGASKDHSSGVIYKQS